MPLTTIKPKLQFLGYRISTICKSIKTLYQLPQDKIDAFMQSYNIYDHDWADENMLIEQMGSNYYQTVKKKLIDYYSVLNHLCSIGQVEKMYIPPAMDLSKSIICNQNLYEEKMSKDIGIQKGQKAIDIGCGRGRVAQHVASLTGAHVTGINIDPNQLESARKFALGRGLAKQTEFKMADINDLPLPFANETFDGGYQIQVFSLSKNLKLLFSEIHRILKPGAKFALLDWVSLKDYDPNNSEHADLMRRIKPLIGAIGTPTIEQFETALKDAGFTILKSENASINGLQAPLIHNADKFFTRATKTIHFLVRWKILPKHFQMLFDRLTLDGQAFVEADRKRLVTTSYYILAQKKK